MANWLGVERHEAEAMYDDGRERCVDFILVLEARYERLETRVERLEAHLLRDFTAHSEGLAAQKQFGEAGLAIAERLFAAWDDYRQAGDPPAAATGSAG